MESGQPRDSGEVRFEEVEIIPASFNGKRIPVPDRWVVTDFKVNGQTATAGQYLDFGTWGITVQPNGIVSTSGSSPHAGTKVEATVWEGEGLARTLNPPGSNEVDDARVAREIIDIPKEIRGELDNIRARFENGGLTRKDVAGLFMNLRNNTDVIIWIINKRLWIEMRPGAIILEGQSRTTVTLLLTVMTLPHLKGSGCSTQGCLRKT